MALYKITLKNSGHSNGIPFEKGMTVQVVTPVTTNPVLSNGGGIVQDAFMRIYGLDIKKAGLMSTGYLDVKLVKK